MGWFWGQSSTTETPKSQDPLRDLDPSLRAFLAKESPVRYTSSNPPPPPAPAAAAPPPPTTQTAPHAESAPEDPAKPIVPRESLYQDGRYAHLWKTYQPQQQIESAGKSDQEKINDVLDGYNQRKAGIGRAALENCALEQSDVNECFRAGGFKSRLTMCRAENKKLERCYMMQSKFLKALGYLSTFERPADVDERIQMHADTLYHRMLDQEEAIDKAKAEGKPIPTFPALITSRASSTAAGKTLEENQVQAADLPASVQASLKKRLEGLGEQERRVEELAIKAEIQAGEQVASQLGTIYDRQAEERRKRKEEGKERIGDRISSIFGFR